MLLVTAGVATLGLGVYLFIAVNSSAQVSTSAKDAEPTKVAERSRAARDGDKPRRKPEAAQPEVKDSPAARGDVRPAPSAPSAPAERPGADIDIDKDEVMASANKAYDRGNMDEALEIAKRVLKDDPTNIRMLRIMVSASCILDDAAVAQRNYLLLPPGSEHREIMRVRCERYGVKLTES